MKLPEPKPTWLRPLTESLTHLIERWTRNASVEPHGERADPSELARLILLDASTEGATDMHLEPRKEGWCVRLRIDGVLHETAHLPHDLGQRLLQHLKSLAGLDPGPVFEPSDSHIPYDLEDRHLDVRFACVPCQFGEKVALRILDSRRIRHRLCQLGMDSEELNLVRQWLATHTGMCLIAGPTSSGKTTTLYALLQELPLATRSVVTIEDPVEYSLEGITQIQVDDRRGLTFPEGLKAMLRLDPDYLILGETRDSLSARIAVEASATGRILMSTLHSRDAVGVVTTLRNWNITDTEIAVSLELVIAQRLVRRLCDKCRRQEDPPDSLRAWLESVGMPVPGTVWRPVGCRACHKTGYAGRIGLFEIWLKSEDDHDAILHHADEKTIRKGLGRRHRKGLLEDGLAKAAEGLTSLDEVKAAGIGNSPGSLKTPRPRPRRPPATRGS